MDRKGPFELSANYPASTSYDNTLPTKSYGTFFLVTPSDNEKSVLEKAALELDRMANARSTWSRLVAIGRRDEELVSAAYAMCATVVRQLKNGWSEK
jgi:hypothetical protein